jgi:hypothetical protein|tara:strand:- start:35 stop:247 length:213 start_codon:yes stop_codon:yes gene_type:complete
MLNSLFESVLDKSRDGFSELMKDKTLLVYILIGMFIVYIAYNVLTTTIKYPVIIIVGIIVGKKLKDHIDK